MRRTTIVIKRTYHNKETVYTASSTLPPLNASTDDYKIIVLDEDDLILEDWYEYGNLNNFLAHLWHEEESYEQYDKLKHFVNNLKWEEIKDE